MAKQTNHHTNDILVGANQQIGNRPNLEDRILVKHTQTFNGVPLTIALVADGVGGSNFGERASELVAETTLREIESATLEKPDQIPGLLKHILEQANHEVYTESRQDKEKRGMGSTAILAAIHNHKLYLANVGDSRAYLIQNGETIKPLTWDHTWSNEMIRLNRLSEEEAKKHPKAEELVRSIGYQPQVEVDLGIYVDTEDDAEAKNKQGFPLKANDRVVLCSDGLIKTRHDGMGHYVEETELRQIVTSRKPEEAAQALVQKAIGRHADDNVSAVVLEMPGSKRAFYLPPTALYGGLGVLGVVIFVFLVALLRGREEPATEPAPPTQPVVMTMVSPPTTQPTATPQIAPGSGMVVQIVSPASRAGGVPFDGSPLPQQRTSDMLEVLQLELPDGTQLFLGEETTIQIVSIAGYAEQTVTEILLENGVLLAAANGGMVEISNELGAKVQTAQGLLGVVYTQSPFNFAASCLQGTCSVKGDLGGEVSLTTGQASSVGGNGQPGESTAALYEQFVGLSLLVPTPTTAPTATATYTPTPTSTATSTPPPTATATTTHTLTPPPASPASEEPGGDPPGPPPPPPGSRPASQP